MAELVKEGWYEDPAGRHQYRWFSEGAPTDLVKDHGSTFKDGMSSAELSNFQPLSAQLAEEPDVGPLLHTDPPPREIWIHNPGVPAGLT